MFLTLQTNASENVFLLTKVYKYRTPSRTLSQLEQYNVLGDRKIHWLGRCNHIKRMTLLPSHGHFRR
jgi:hypothetical protein